MGKFDNEYMEMRDRIFSLLTERGITQKDLALNLHVTPQTITDWKKGKSHSFSSMIGKLSKILNTSPSWLLFGTGARYVSPEDLSVLEQEDNQRLLDYKMHTLKEQVKTQEFVAETIRKKVIEAGWKESDFEDIDFNSLAIALGVSKDYLLGNANVSKVKGFRIPVYRAVAAGIPIEAIEDIIDYEEIDPELAATGEFFGLRIQGSSMEPRICEGDVVIVRKQEDADSGDVAIVLVNGNDATCKRVKKEAHGLTLIPNNPAFPIKYYSAEEISSLPVRIIGKVVELRGKF